MTNIEIKQIIINEVKPYLDLRSKTAWQTPSNRLLLKELNLKYNNLFQGIGELIYLVKNIDDIDNMVIYCPMCGKKNPYFKNHYQSHCCQKCAANDPKVRKQIEETSYKHCGYKCNFASPDKRLNGRATMKEKTGYESYAQIPGWKELCQEHAKNRTPKQKLEIKKKSEKTYYKNHGCRHNWASKDPELNGCATRNEKYGVDYIMSNPYYKKLSVETRLNDIDENGLNSYQRGGLKAVSTSLNNIDENGLNSYQRGVIKAEKTTEDRYGEKHFTQTIYFKQLFENKEWVDEVNQKIYETKKKNGTLKGSNSENIIYQALVYKFDFEDIKYQYKDKQRYDFVCDFYIKSLDLFIEVNFDPSHGFEPFNIDNPKHIERVKKWKLQSEEINLKTGKKKDRYLNFIAIWTLADPEKLKTAKQNKLNYLAFYNWQQFFDWYITLP